MYAADFMPIRSIMKEIVFLRRRMDYSLFFFFYRCNNNYEIWKGMMGEINVVQTDGLRDKYEM